ncbi:hypothetical protein J2X46_002548 [Nocardioides sp. BE266]|uniref:DUF4037 domain-containing protein n=1 Tax=Nocardioides sp. BE266 TaxID=2817725 RepID=UPI002854225F|nr:DUF4037 domain-containing protein [Nocardioides sp. BE266]MDR7253558.1 hypothetical protein [Nocardioides sp. BE266]
MSRFVPGIDLCRRLYDEQVGPVLAGSFPSLRHSAALLGRGSEVLGFDDETSTDHDWAARVLLFLTDEDEATLGAEVTQRLDEALPPTFGGHPVRHEVHTVRGFVQQQLALDLDREVRAVDWLTMPENSLRSVTAGAVFHDEVGLGAVRERLSYYPRDVWFYLMITGWWRVHPEANLVGRTGSVGDELGSAVLGTRLAKDLMRLAFLMEREYAPYDKWFGTAFARLGCGPALTPYLNAVVHARSWQEREDALVGATTALVDVHNRLGLTAPVAVEVVQMWDRPFRVAWAEIPELLHAQIDDQEVLQISGKWPLGPVDQLRELTWAVRRRPAFLRIFSDLADGAATGQ